MKVTTGEMRHLITIHAPEGTYGDGSAQHVRTGIPAKIASLPLQGQQQERMLIGGLNIQTIYSVFIRYMEGVQPDFEIREECHTQRVFQIVAILPSDKFDWLEFTCVVGER